MSDGVIVRVSFWDTFQIYVLAIFFSVWTCLKSLFNWVWTYNVVTKTKIRGNPPSILVDTTVGRHSYVKIKGVKLHYVEAGEHGSPCVLLLHGFPDCWVGWRHQLSLLAQTHHVIALDLLGCGDSDKPTSRLHYAPHRLLPQLRVVLEVLMHKSSNRAVTIIAHDLGGLLAWYLAHESPELIDSLVLVSAPHPNIYWQSLPASSLFNINWMYMAQVPLLAECEAQKGDMALLERCHQHLLKRGGNSTSASLLEALKYVFSRYQDWTGPINYFRNLIFWRIAEDRGKLKIPVLLITGNQDTQVTLESMVRSSEWCSQAALKIVEGAGHFPHQESPQHFNKLLQEFLTTDNIIPSTKGGLGSISVDTARGLVGKMLGAVHIFT